MVISGELTNRENIFDDVRSKENIVEAKGTGKGGVTGANHREWHRCQQQWKRERWRKRIR